MLVVNKHSGAFAPVHNAREWVRAGVGPTGGWGGCETNLGAWGGCGTKPGRAWRDWKPVNGPVRVWSRCATKPEGGAGVRPTSGHGAGVGPSPAGPGGTGN